MPVVTSQTRPDLICQTRKPCVPFGNNATHRTHLNVSKEPASSPVTIYIRTVCHTSPTRCVSRRMQQRPLKTRFAFPVSAFQNRRPPSPPLCCRFQFRIVAPQAPEATCPVMRECNRVHTPHPKRSVSRHCIPDPN